MTTKKAQILAQSRAKRRETAGARTDTIADRIARIPSVGMRKHAFTRGRRAGHDNTTTKELFRQIHLGKEDLIEYMKTAFRNHKQFR